MVKIKFCFREGVAMGNRLRKLRVRRGLSQAGLARRARVHPADVSRFESGYARPYPGQLRRIARALGVRPEELMQLFEVRRRASGQRDWRAESEQAVAMS
jgi:transcriptional regulator with XRE-family HTH domain